MNPELMVVAAANLIINELTTDELIVTNLIIQMGDDPRNVPFYAKISPLFDSKKLDGTPIAHDLTRRAVFQAVKRRTVKEQDHG